LDTNKEKIKPVYNNRCSSAIPKIAINQNKKEVKKIVVE
jgi:hypothetical protein